MSTNNMSYIDSLETNMSYFEELPKDESSLMIYKEMLDSNLINEEQYKLLI